MNRSYSVRGGEMNEQADCKEPINKGGKGATMEWWDSPGIGQRASSYTRTIPDWASQASTLTTGIGVALQLPTVN